MKHISVERITPSLNSSFYCNIQETAFFPRPLHIHPEYELILLESGGGMVFVGDMTCPLKPGMLMLMGRHLPHFWLSSKEYYAPDSKLVSRCVYSQFSTDIFPLHWEELPEFYAIRNLLTQSERGVLFAGERLPELRDRFIKLLTLKNLDKLIELYQLLNELATLENNNCMSSIAYKSEDSANDDPILQKAQFYMNTHYNDNISLSQIADAAGMNHTALCRYYKKHTGKTIFEHLTELRISYASKLLLNKTLSVAQIAYDCGYTSPSHFIEQFKKITGKTPREYTKKFTGSISI